MRIISVFLRARSRSELLLSLQGRRRMQINIGAHKGANNESEKDKRAQFQGYFVPGNGRISPPLAADSLTCPRPFPLLLPHCVASLSHL